MDLKRSTVASIGWMIARVGWTNASTFLLFVVLTRLLDPVTFGIFALSTVFVDVARALSTAGLPDAIMREHELNEETADTAFWTNLGFAVIVMLATLGIAGPYASFMGQPVVREVIMVLALLMPLAALGGIHTARLQREFGHKALALRTMVATLIASLGAILAAWLGAGVWSLVVQAAIIDVLQLALALYTFPWRPRFRFSVPTLRRLLGFSLGMVVTQLSWLLLIRTPELFIGRVLGTDAVGRYRVSWRLIDLLGQAVLTPMSNVSLITLAKVQKERERFRKIYGLMVGAASLVALPALFGMGAVADDLIPLVFGSHWQGNGDLVRTLALMALPFTMNYFVPPALAALGHSKAIMRVALVQLVLTVAFSWFAAPYGLVAIAFAYVLRAYLTVPYQLLILQRHSGISALGALKGTIGPLFSAAIMAAAVFAARAPLVAPDWSRIGRLAVLVPLGVAIYAIGLLVTARGEIRAIADMILPMLRRKTIAVEATPAPAEGR